MRQEECRYIIAEAILKDGDEVVVFNPVDFLFRHSMSHAGAKLIEYQLQLLIKFDLSNLESYNSKNKDDWTFVIRIIL